MAEEFNPNLVYTTPGGTGDGPRRGQHQQFGVLHHPGVNRGLDFGFTLFGFQTVDQAIGSTTVLKSIEAMPYESGSGNAYLQTPITITSATVYQDTQTAC